jgi:hypothetical protein
MCSAVSATTPTCQRDIGARKAFAWLPNGARQIGLWYFFGSTNKKGPGISAESLISNRILVGGAGFEPATPAV